MRPKRYTVFNDEGTVVAVLDPGKDDCTPYAGGDYNGHCGGCDTCLLMQAEHVEMRIESEELPFDGTLDLLRAAAR